MRTLNISYGKGMPTVGFHYDANTDMSVSQAERPLKMAYQVPLECVRPLIAKLCENARHHSHYGLGMALSASEQQALQSALAGDPSPDGWEVLKVGLADAKLYFDLRNVVGYVEEIEIPGVALAKTVETLTMKFLGVGDSLGLNIGPEALTCVYARGATEDMLLIRHVARPGREGLEAKQWHLVSRQEYSW